MTWESQLLKEDSDLLQKVSPKQKKKLKKLIQTSEPSEYMGQDFTKMSDLVKELKSLDMMKSDKKMLKKMNKIDEANVSLIAAASELRKDYETLYRQLRGLVYPKSKGDLGDEKNE
jgi:ABC-type phosphate transport system auxiliary subunit